MMRKKRIRVNKGEMIKNAVILAEGLFPDPKSGKEKRDFVVDLINNAINIPILNEKQEEKIIGYAVDIVVDLVFSARSKKND